jgi:MFS family permease
MADIKDLIEPALSWQTLLGAVLAFSLIPGVVLHVAVLLYPKGHPRRPELVAELKAVPRPQRPFWVAETLVGVAFEAIPLRIRQIRNRLMALSGVRGRLIMFSMGTLLGATLIGAVAMLLPSVVGVIGLMVLVVLAGIIGILSANADETDRPRIIRG